MTIPTDALPLAGGLALLAGAAAWVCGARVVPSLWAALLVAANVLVAQPVLDDVGAETPQLVAREAGPWRAGHAAWLLSPSVFDPTPERVAFADSVTGVATLPAAVALDHRGHRPVPGHVPWLGLTALWLALVGLTSPGATSGAWLVRGLLVVAVGAATFASAAPWAQAAAVALWAALAARGLAWLDARADESLGAAVPMGAAALAVVAGGAAIGAATWLGIETDARALEPLLARLDDADAILARPALVTACAEQLRRVLDVAAGVGTVSMGVLLWHLKSRGVASRLTLVALSLVELVGSVYVFRSL